MQIKILGSAAAEGWPAVFCGCETCRRARRLGGKNIRSRASVQLGPKHMVELPPDTWYHAAVLDSDLSQLEHVFVSHSHGDHWSMPNLAFLLPPFAHDRPEVLTVYGNDVVVRQARDRFPNLLEKGALALVELEPFVPVQAGEMVLTPTRAMHTTNETCLCYVIEQDGRTLLYASDTGWLPDDTWEFLKGIHLDCVIHECTCGPLPHWEYHSNFEHLFMTKERLEEFGSLTGGPFIVTHFSHNVKLMHDEISEIVSPHGIQTAYDGMELKI